MVKNANYSADENFVERVRRSLKPVKKEVHVVENGKAKKLEVRRIAVGPIITRYGNFMVYEFKINDRWKDYEVLVNARAFDKEFMPLFERGRELLIKTDSGCRTGEIYLDRTCTCRQQLHSAMEAIGKRGNGLIITIPNQEGRGHGYAKKYATLVLQKELGYDTYEASKAVNKKVDVRDYYGAVAILKFFGVGQAHRLEVIANNTSKLKEVLENGYRARLTKQDIRADRYTIKHLRAKRDKLGEMVKV